VPVELWAAPIVGLLFIAGKLLLFQFVFAHSSNTALSKHLWALWAALLSTRPQMRQIHRPAGPRAPCFVEKIAGGIRIWMANYIIKNIG